ncbi:type IV secretion system protein [Caballeronia sp. LZ043]|uniref:type IV secretion system protein n=1 Tax=Caballeronia sp. LZ043 TaxID=3038569 RepID=UPI0028579E2F|nr:type IV secretion system protein [Caballeronia sp. LZ043]MDR5826077.1 type IV secretion system protein [Caballeronia sp. LZ043]
MTMRSPYHFVRVVFLLMSVAVGAICLPQSAAAQTNAAPTSGTGAGQGTVLVSPNGDFGAGAAQAAQQIDSLLGSIIPSAVDASNSVMPEANKFAWGLGVISLVLVGIRFAGTHHPVAAWVNVFEELAILGIFVALYLGYTSIATGFWTWFQQLATSIGGSQDGATGAAMARLAGVVFDAIKTKLSTVTLWNLPALLADSIALILAACLMCIASVIFVYYTAVGKIQAAIGIVLGPIALALGFSSYTRNYFVKWLDWMISAGMYVVIVAILFKLIGASIVSAVNKASDVGGSTVLNGAYIFNLAVFILLLSFEIPKLATVFGGGATASGTSALKLASRMIP